MSSPAIPPEKMAPVDALQQAAEKRPLRSFISPTFFHVFPAKSIFQQVPSKMSARCGTPSNGKANPFSIFLGKGGSGVERGGTGNVLGSRDRISTVSVLSSVPVPPIASRT